MMLVCLQAGLLAAFYLLLPRFTTLRFLLPAFASALIACGLCARSRNETVAQNRCRHHRGGTYRPCRPMLFLAERQMDANWRWRSTQIRAAAALQPFVSERPCLIIANSSGPLAFYLGCETVHRELKASTQTSHSSQSRRSIRACGLSGALRPAATVLMATGTHPRASASFQSTSPCVTDLGCSTARFGPVNMASRIVAEFSHVHSSKKPVAS
jgi:hypothetical protein